jgi:sRNA-binding carbon storage regulator CsrA
MLMLTRRRGESVDIYDKNGNVVVTIHVNEFLPSNVVRLGFAATRDYTILRDNAKTRDVPHASPHAAPRDDPEPPPNGPPSVTYRRPRRS